MPVNSCVTKGCGRYELEDENARLREAGRKLVEANTKHFNTATENYKEVVRLREELAAKDSTIASCDELLALSRSERDSLREQLAAAQADAARYRKLRELNDSTADGGWLVNTQHGWAKDLDAAIDKAIEQEQCE